VVLQFSDQSKLFLKVDALSRSMNDWVRKLFIEHADLFLRSMDARWSRTEEIVDGMIRLLNGFGIASGNLLDLCCGNGRISVHMAKRGFKALGVDISKPFLEDAKKKAKENKLSDSVTFLEGDVRRLKKIIGDNQGPFDVVVNAWTSIGYYSQKDDLRIFKQARELSREGAILFVAETMHSDFLSVKFTPTSYAELDNIVMLENRKYDPTTSQMSTSWAFYRKQGQDLRFIASVDLDLHAYSLYELASLLRNAGWETVASYGSLSTLQSMSPLTSLNIVAKAGASNY
jgi:2-polyprenyl-3-methyl-5-hydroxy-6-metoxy-1,4-benzoquinol methylase